MENKLSFKVDYLNGIVPITRVDSFFESLRNIDENFDLSYWVQNCFAVRGIRNYNTRFHYQGKNDFIISWNAFDEFNTFVAKSPEECKFNPYIYISLSGSAISLFNEDSFKRFVKYLFRVGFKCTRLDVACDILNRENEIIPFILQSFKYNSRLKPENVPFVTSKMSLEPKRIKSSGRYKRPVQYISVGDINGNISTNLTFGDHGSDLGMFRCYDKFLERGLDCDFNPLVSQFFPDRYWYRLEVELHKKHSKALFDIWASLDLPLYDLFASAICSMFEIRVSKSCVSRVNNCSISPLWADFLNSLSNNIHFVELEKKPVPVVELPFEELKAIFEHYAPLLCAFDDFCIYDSKFKSHILSGNRYRYENNQRYSYLRNMVDKKIQFQQQQQAIAI